MNEITTFLIPYSNHRWTVPLANSSTAKKQRFMAASQLTRRKIFEPPYSFRTAIITGSNGKGSTASILARLLMESGADVGVISSPAMHDDCTDMVSVNGNNVSRKRLLAGLIEAKSKLSALSGDPELTHYMLLCVAAYDYFRELDVDYVVAETAIGGLYDPTVPLAPDICMFTNVSEEHTDVLGDSLEKIARHKSYIIGPRSHAILGEEITDEVADAISLRAHAQRATVTRVSATLSGQRGVIWEDAASTIVDGGFCPEYQHPNLRLAAKAYCVLRETGQEPIFVDLVSMGPRLFPPNRFELRERNGVQYLFDSAHNADGYRKLSRSLARYFNPDELSFLHGAASDHLLRSFRGVLQPRKVTYVSGYHQRVPLEEGFTDLYQVDFEAIEREPDTSVIVILGMFLPPKVKQLLFSAADTQALTIEGSGRGLQ